MKAAFLITRSPEYRLYAPMIDAALGRGWGVECWHDYGQAQTGLKGYQFPSVDVVPSFKNGVPVVRPYKGASELQARLAEMNVNAVVAWPTPEAALGRAPSSPRPLWVHQQYLLDSFCAFTPSSLLAADLLAVFSRWWLDWAGSYFELCGLVPDGRAFIREAEKRTVFVGHPELDAFPLVDADEARRRWRIPRDRPVVVLFPFPQGVGRSLFWPRKICGEPSRIKQVANVILHRRFDYWPDVRNGWNDLNVVTAIRRFCDRNGAYLLIKSRRKTPIPTYAADLADGCVYDEDLYPATILDVLKVASLSIGYYSNCVFESVALGVPHLCVTFSGRDYSGDVANGGESGNLYFDQFYSQKSGGPFEFPGVSTAWSIPETIDRLPGRSFADFALDETARARYIQKFLTHNAKDGSVRTFEAIERTLLRTANQNTPVARP